MHELGYSRRHFYREQQRAIAMLSALLRENLPQQECTQSVDLAVEADDLLSAEAKRFLAERENVAIEHIIERVLEIAGQLAGQYGVTLECDLDPHMPPVYASRTLLRQVFLETLSVLITQVGARSVRVQTHYDRQGILVHISAETRSAYLEPGDGQDHEPPLRHVRHLVEIIGGQWQKPQTSPERCVCRFSLPTSSSKVLLVIDDDEAIIQAFRRYLVSYDYQVVGATTGAEAVQKAREMNPAAITLDVMMPSQDGWEIISSLKSDPTVRDVPVIICSVLEDPELARSLGAAAYLRKPITQTTLVTTLDRLLRET
jgi:CheY-like chemotaxis protein